MILEKRQFLYPLPIERIADPVFEYATNYLLTQQDIIIRDDRTIQSSLNTLDENVQESISAVQDQQSFDLVFGLIRGFEGNLAFKPMRFLQEMMDKLGRWVNQTIRTVSNLDETEVTSELKNSLKMILFLSFYLIKISTQVKKQKDVLQKVTDICKKKKKKEAINTSLSVNAQKLQWSLILSVAKSLNQINFRGLWKQQEMDQNLLVYYINMSFYLINSSMVKDDVMRKVVQTILSKVLQLKPSLTKIIKRQFLKYVMQSQSSCQIIVEYFSKSNSIDTQNLFRQIVLQSLVTIKQNKGSDNPQMKNLATFFNKLGEKYSQIIMNNLHYFEIIYDSECYHLRNSLTTIIYYIIKKLSKEQDSKKAKQNLLNLLLERIYDKIVHSRSHTLNILGMMIEQNLLEKNLIKQVFKKAIERMNDQGVNPRKRAISLTFQCTKTFFFLIKTIPKQKLLRVSQVQKQIAISETTLTSLLQISQTLKARILSSDKNQTEAETLLSDLKFNQQQLAETHLLLDHYKLYLEVLLIIQSILPVCQNLLSSSTTSDIIETIKLVVFLKQSEIQNVDKIILQIWRLIFCDEAQVSAEVFNSFMTLHIQKKETRAENLIKLFVTSNSKDILCFEKIIHLLLSKHREKELLDEGFVQKVWSRFKLLITKNNKQANSTRQIKSISKLLKCVFQNDKSLIKSSHTMFALSYVQDHFLQKDNEPDPNILIFFFHLMKIAKNMMDQSSKEYFLLQVMPLVCDDKHFPLNIWCNVLEGMLEVGLVINPHPQTFMKFILKKLSDRTVNSKKEFKDGKISEQAMVNSMLKFYYFLGQMIGKLSQITHTLSDTVRQVTTAAVNQARRKGHTMANQAKEEKDRNQAMDWTNSQVISIEQQGDNMIKQLESKSQKLILHNQLQAWISETISCIKRIMNKGPDGSAIERICVINFGKLMCNKNFAVENVKYLIYLMTKCPDEILKTTAIITFADAISENSSSLSSYTEALFECVLDESKKVQLVAFSTIWYLVMNNIMLFQNQILFMAMVFETESDEIKDCCKKFLTEHNKRNEAFLLGKIPEVLGELSEEGKMLGKRKVTLKSYQCYAKQIFPQIEKGKDKGMVETVTSAIVQMISNSLTPLLTKNACLSLSLLSHNDKSITRILEGHSFIIGKVKDEECRGYFRDLILKVKRTLKDSKELIDELEAKFVQYSEFSYKRKQVAPHLASSLKGAKNTKREPKKKNQKKKPQSQSEAVLINESESEENPEKSQRRRDKKKDQEPISVQSQDDVPVRPARRNPKVTYIEEESNSQ